MFAPKVAALQVEAAGKLASHRSALVKHRLQRAIGSRATLPAAAQRASSQAGDEFGDDLDRHDAAVSAMARGSSRGASWELGKVPLAPANRPEQLQAPSSVAPLPLPAALQAKLAVGEVNDPLEHEADRVAEQVTRMPTPAVGPTSAPPWISRKSAGSEAVGQQERRPFGPGTAVAVPASVQGVLRSGGRPLDAVTRAFFEPRFGRDFSQVRVHDDESAAASARDVNASAYTMGHNVVFGAGRFAPATPVGQRLLAHELTHTVQQGRSAPVALQRKVDPKACLAQRDEILPPIGAVATIDREQTLWDVLGLEYDPLKKRILADTEARQFVCDAGVPAILALWDKRTAAGELDVTAARTALAADKANVYSKHLDASWLRKRRLGRAETELGTVAASVDSQARAARPLHRLLLPQLKAPLKENVTAAAKELDALTPVFEAATKAFRAAAPTAFQLGEQLDRARTEAIKARNGDYLGGPREALAQAVKTARKLQQQLEVAHLGTDVDDLVKTSQEVAAAVANLPSTSDSDTIAGVLEVAKTFRKNVAERSTTVADLAGAARRVSFVLRYVAALNTPDFANPPGKDEMQSMRGHIDLLGPDLELLFGGGTATSLDLFEELGKRINRQLNQRSTMESALGHETALVPSQADAQSFFKTLEKKTNLEVTAAYISYAGAFFEHRIVVRLEDFNVTGLDELFARPLSLGGLRPLVCTGYAVLGAALLGMAGAKLQEFIVAVRVSDQQLRTGQLDEGHAVAVVKRKGATLYVSNDQVVDDEDDAIGRNAVAWHHPENPIVHASGKTVQEATAALRKELARRRSLLP